MNHNHETYWYSRKHYKGSNLIKHHCSLGPLSMTIVSMVWHAWNIPSGPHKVRVLKNVILIFVYANVSTISIDNLVITTFSMSFPLNDGVGLELALLVLATVRTLVELNQVSRGTTIVRQVSCTSTSIGATLLIRCFTCDLLRFASSMGLSLCRRVRSRHR